MVKNLPAVRETQVQSLGWRDALGHYSPLPVFFPGKFRGQRSLAGHSPWGGKKSNTTQ